MEDAPRARGRHNLAIAKNLAIANNFAVAKNLAAADNFAVPILAVDADRWSVSDPVTPPERTRPASPRHR